MNKRITEIEKQSYTEVIHERGGTYMAFDKQKFAELIVRECDRYVAEQYDELEPWMQPGDLLKHFGVEE